MFRRNRENDAVNESDATDAEALADGGDLPAAVAAEVFGTGPWDISEAPDDGVARIDFGSLQIPGVEGMNVNLEVDEQTQNVVAITVILGEGGIQLQPFAAPRSGDFWEEVRSELTAGITSSGGVVDEATGTLGPELRANVPAVSEEGEQVMQQVRFVGFDGPRWMLRGVLLGAAAVDDRAAEVFEDIFSGCIVSRGNQPMAPGDMLPLELPADAVAQDEDGNPIESEDETPSLDPFERGPEITEIR